MSAPPKMPAVGVGIIIRRGNQVLLLRRKNVHGSGTWSTPGGHLDFGESPEACAVREAREETGLEVHDPQFIGITNDIFAPEGRHYITVWMEASYQSGEPVLNAPYESDQIGWFPLDELPQPLFIPLKHLLGGDCYQSNSRFAPSRGQ